MISTCSSSTSAYLFEGWQLTPEGAAINSGERTAVIADLHLGYEWARGAAGDCVVAHSLAETIARLALVLSRTPITRVLVAGDLVESLRPCPRTTADVRRLCSWLAMQGVDLLVVEGNHDRSLLGSSPGLSPRAHGLPATCTLAGWTVGHGHRTLAGPRTISGHHHPVLRYAGTAAPCFLVGPGRIVLPAFSSNAAGCDITSNGGPKHWRAAPLRCIASTGSELLDFGMLRDLRHRLRRHAR
jgi:putative SbcD/Mre11-related phosphoesterase